MCSTHNEQLINMKCCWQRDTSKPLSGNEAYLQENQLLWDLIEGFSISQNFVSVTCTPWLLTPSSIIFHWWLVLMWQVHQKIQLNVCVRQKLALLIVANRIVSLQMIINNLSWEIVLLLNPFLPTYLSLKGKPGEID